MPIGTLAAMIFALLVMAQATSLPPARLIPPPPPADVDALAAKDPAADLASARRMLSENGVPSARRLVAAMPGGQGVEHWPSVGKNRKLPTLRCDHLAVDEHVIPDIDEFLPIGEGLLTHIRQGQHRLDLLTRSSAQGGEAQFAGIENEHHAAGNPNHQPR